MVDVCIDLANVVKIAMGRPDVKEQEEDAASIALPMRSSLI